MKSDIFFRICMFIKMLCAVEESMSLRCLSLASNDEYNLDKCKNKTCRFSMQFLLFILTYYVYGHVPLRWNVNIFIPASYCKVSYLYLNQSFIPQRSKVIFKQCKVFSAYFQDRLLFEELVVHWQAPIVINKFFPSRIEQVSD